MTSSRWRREPHSTADQPHKRRAVQSMRTASFFGDPELPRQPLAPGDKIVPKIFASARGVLLTGVDARLSLVNSVRGNNN